MLEKLKQLLQKNTTTKQSGSEEIKLQTVDDRVSSLRNKILAVSIGIFGVIILFLSLKDIITPLFSKGAPQKAEQERAKLLAPPKDAKRGEIVETQNLEEDWKTLVERKIQEIETQSKETDLKLNEIIERLDKKDASQATYPKAPLPPPPPVPTVTPQQASQVQTGHVPPPPTPPTPLSTPTYTSPPTTTPPQQTKPEVQPVFRSIEFNIKSEEPQKKEEQSQSKSEQMHLPIGIATGLTITGMDAPTFQWGQQEPQVMLISTESDLVTASGKEIPFKNCMILASGYGAVSSEKAMLRLVHANCRNKKGDLYAGNIEGWVLGDDGKIGMTGRLVSRQGSVIAKSFWADVLSLGGSYLRQRATTISISPLGSTETVSDTKLLEAAAGQAIERTTGRIAQFFIKIAEQIYPVIEVQPGRNVTVLVKHGTLSKVTKDNYDEVTRTAAAVAQPQQAAKQ